MPEVPSCGNWPKASWLPVRSQSLTQTESFREMMPISRRQALKLTLPAAGLATTVWYPSTVTADSGYVPSGYTLSWSDEFNQLNLGNQTGKWLPYWGGWNVRHLAGNNDKGVKYADYETLPGGGTAGEMLRLAGQWGAGPFLHEVSNGTLKLRCFPVPSAMRNQIGFPYIGSMISGERMPAQRQGYWETRLRLPRMGTGLHFAVWLLNNRFEWPPEIDIVEMVGQHPERFFASTHIKNATPPPGTLYYAPNGASGWHVFGFEWTDQYMRWTVNGATVREHGALFSDHELYILFSWEIGSNWPGMPDGSTPWPGEAEIDYVRLYHRSPSSTIVSGDIAPTWPVSKVRGKKNKKLR